MTTEKFVMAIDQGTTSTRAIIFHPSGEIVSGGQTDFTQSVSNGDLGFCTNSCCRSPTES